MGSLAPPRKQYVLGLRLFGGSTGIRRRTGTTPSPSPPADKSLDAYNVLGRSVGGTTKAHALRRQHGPDVFYRRGGIKLRWLRMRCAGVTGKCSRTDYPAALDETDKDANMEMTPVLCLKHEHRGSPSVPSTPCGCVYHVVVDKAGHHFLPPFPPLFSNCISWAPIEVFARSAAPSIPADLSRTHPPPTRWWHTPSLPVWNQGEYFRHFILGAETAGQHHVGAGITHEH